MGDLFGLLSGLTPPQLPPDQPEPRIKELYPKQFKKLQKLEKFDVLLSFARLKKSRIYLIDNITRDMEIEEKKVRKITNYVFQHKEMIKEDLKKHNKYLQNHKKKSKK